MIVAAGVVAGAAAAGASPAARALPGWPLYDRYCLACHGAAGDGRGPAAPYTRGRPRDLTRGAYWWGSTPAGQPPTDDDLRATIRHGARGTSMHGFVLADAQVDALIAVVKAFAPGTGAVRAAPIALGPPPAAAADPAHGARLWRQYGCVSCHADDGRGHAALGAFDLRTEPLRRPRADDDRAARRRAAALAIATGVGPMPGYAGTASAADVWALADHVLALHAPARRPRSPRSRRSTTARSPPTARPRS